MISTMWRCASNLGSASRCCRTWPGLLHVKSRSLVTTSAFPRSSRGRSSAPPPAGRRVSPRIRQQTELQYYVTCHPGLEAAVAQQLRSDPINASNVEVGQAGVSFTGPDLGVGFKCNLWLRSAIRVLVRLSEAPLDTRRAAGDTIYDYVRSAADWAHLLPKDGTLSVSARVWGCTTVSNSELVEKRVRDAVCDAVRDARGTRPAPPRGRADLPLFVTLYKDRMILYRDMSGESLHRRGYRDALHKAPLNEAAAAGVLQLAQWPDICQDPDMALVDPMCGSGTLLIEAALMATNTAPGVFRETAAWPFIGWPDFQGQQWAQCLEEARDLRRPWAGTLQGNDVHSGALALAAKDVQAAGVGGIVNLSRGDCRAWVPELKPDLVVTNPPWGTRLLAAGGPGGRERAGGRDMGGRDMGGRDMRGRDMRGRDMGGRDMRGRDMGGRDMRGRDMRGRDMGGRDMQQRGAAWARGGDGGGRERAAAQASETSPELSDAWSALSSFVKTQCGGATAYVLSGNPQLSQAIKMRASEKWGITVGGQETMLLQYQVRGTQPAADAATDAAGAAAQ